MDAWRINPDEIESVIDLNRYDVIDYQQAQKSNPGSEALSQNFASQIAGNPLQDVFHSLHKRAPEFRESLSPGLSPLKSIIEKAQSTPEWDKLRSPSDSLLSLMGATSFLEKTIAALPQDTKKALSEQAGKHEAHQTREKLIQQWEAQKQALDDLISEVEESGKEAPQALQDAQSTLTNKLADYQEIQENSLEQLATYTEKAQESLTENHDQVMGAINQSAKEASQDAQAKSQAIKSFGLLAGEDNLDQMDLATIQAALEIISQMTDVRKFADLLGWAKRVIRQEKRIAPGNGARIVGFKRGELRMSEIAPNELIAMSMPTDNAMHAGFIERLADDSILHFDKEGQEDQDAGKGDMYFLVDESGSMSSDEVSTAKAFVWRMAEIAREDDRGLTVIPFSGDNQYKTWDMPPKGQPDAQGLMTILKRSYSGGTEVYKPLAKALKLIADRDSESDIVIITDGAFPAPPASFLTRLASAKDQNPVKIILVSVGGVNNTPAKEFCDKVISITDLHKGKEGLRDVIQSII